MSSPVEDIGEELVAATVLVFAENGVALTDVTRCGLTEGFVEPTAILGFGGDVMRGAIALEAPWSVLQASHPLKSAANEDLTDWLGELSNLVLGRLKAKLRQSSATIQIGVPLTFTSARHVPAEIPPSVQYRLRAGDAWVLVRLTAAIDAAFKLVPGADAAPVEGFELF